MRDKQTQNALKRRRLLAKQFLHALNEKREDIADKSTPKTEKAFALALTVRHLAEDYNLPTTGGIPAKIEKWLREGNATIEDVEKMLKPARLFWSEGLTVRRDGTWLAASQERLAEFADFIRPDHIYLDVTTATIEDVKFIWGERQSEKEKRHAALENVPMIAKERAEHLTALLQPKKRETRVEKTLRENNVKYKLQAIGAKPPRDGRKHTLAELAAYYGKYLRRKFDSNRPYIFPDSRDQPNTVAGLQDLIEALQLLNLETPFGGKRGRKKGYETQWAKWRERAKRNGWKETHEAYVEGMKEKYVRTEGDARGWKASEERRKAMKHFRENVPKPKTPG